MITIAIPTGLLNAFLQHCDDQGWGRLSWLTWCNEVTRWVEETYTDRSDDERSALIAWLSDEWRQV